MLIKHIAMGALGLVFGASAAAGSFALAVKLGIIPEMSEKSHTARHIMTYENATILGGILGNLLSVFGAIYLPLGRVFLIFYGLSAGLFVGCMAMALAEIINVFPILYRRLQLKQGIFWVIGSAAAGKLCGCLYYFLKGVGA